MSNMAPTTTEDEHMNAREQAARSTFELLGFNEESTGGNCTAWRMGLRNGREVLVTDRNSSSVLDMDDPCEMHFMDGQSGEPVQSMYFASAETLVAWINEQAKKGEGSTASVLDLCYA
jgi:hypothetical protein